MDADTIPAKRARELRDAWEEFVADASDRGSAGAGTPEIRDPIADSWLRSRDAGVDPSGRQAAPSVVERDGAIEAWESHPLVAAMPIIDECLASSAVDAEHLIVVGDADGMLLSVRGSALLRARAADEMNFVEGALWSESGAGTNAVGTALAAGHAVQVFAAEHFTEPVQRWTCAAAPIFDPDGGDLLGIIDVTGDISAVHPHSLAVVVATAQAVEGFLRGRLHERDDRLRERFGGRLAGIGAALVTGSGRLLVGGGAQWGDDVPAVIPAGGGQLVLPSGRPAIAEPIGEDDVYVLRRDDVRTRRPRPLLELSLLGDDAGRVQLDGEPLGLRRRHLDLLALLALRGGPGVTADVLCTDLYGDEGNVASVRVEMSRLRRLLPGAIDPERYRLACSVDADFARVRALLSRNAVAEAAAVYAGPLLPESRSPGVERERDAIDGWLRQAVLTGDDVDALWSWVTTPSGDEDLLAWQRLLALVDYEDPRRSRIASRTAALRRLLA